MRDSIGGECRNVQSLLTLLKHRPDLLSSKHVLVVDEVGFLGSQALHDVMALVYPERFQKRKVLETKLAEQSIELERIQSAREQKRHLASDVAAWQDEHRSVGQLFQGIRADVMAQADGWDEAQQCLNPYMLKRHPDFEAQDSKSQARDAKAFALMEDIEQYENILKDLGIEQSIIEKQALNHEFRHVLKSYAELEDEQTKEQYAYTILEMVETHPHLYRIFLDLKLDGKLLRQQTKQHAIVLERAELQGEALAAFNTVHRYDEAYEQAAELSKRMIAIRRLRDYQKGCPQSLTLDGVEPYRLQWGYTLPYIIKQAATALQHGPLHTHNINQGFEQREAPIHEHTLATPNNLKAQPPLDWQVSESHGFSIDSHKEAQYQQHVLHTHAYSKAHCYCQACHDTKGLNETRKPVNIERNALAYGINLKEPYDKALIVQYSLLSKRSQDLQAHATQAMLHRACQERNGYAAWHHLDGHQSLVRHFTTPKETYPHLIKAGHTETLSVIMPLLDEDQKRAFKRAQAYVEQSEHLEEAKSYLSFTDKVKATHGRNKEAYQDALHFYRIGGDTGLEREPRDRNEALHQLKAQAHYYQSIERDWLDYQFEGEPTRRHCAHRLMKHKLQAYGFVLATKRQKAESYWQQLQSDGKDFRQAPSKPLSFELSVGEEGTYKGMTAIAGNRYGMLERKKQIKLLSKEQSKYLYVGQHYQVYCKKGDLQLAPAERAFNQSLGMGMEI